MNFEERYTYMIERKHHFMGYRQMKTLKTELIKMNAAYQLKLKRNSNNKMTMFLMSIIYRRLILTINITFTNEPYAKYMVFSKKTPIS